MVQTIATLANILKDDYQDGIRNQLQKRALCLRLFKEGIAKWNGSVFVIPLRTGRNTAIGYRTDNETLGLTADRQKFKRITADSVFLYGEFTVTGPSIAASEMDGLNCGSSSSK